MHHNITNIPFSCLVDEIGCHLADVYFVTFSIAFHSRCRVHSLYIHAYEWKLYKKAFDQKNTSQRQYYLQCRLYKTYISTYITKQLEARFLTTQHTSCRWTRIQSYTKR
jgi:hypothetical protein